MAVYHTSQSMKIMCDYLLDRYNEQPWNLKYLLLGKFQSDMLESHFGHMRKLAGSNYWTTVRNFLQSESVIRKTNLLWYSGYDITEVEKAMSEASRTTRKTDDEVIEVILQRLAVIQEGASDEELYEPPSDAKPALGHVSGYLAYQTTKKKSCEGCQQLLVDKDAEFKEPVFDQAEVNEQYLFMTETLNRGGLKAPTMMAVNATIIIAKVWRFILSDDELRSRFMSSVNSRSVFQQIIVSFLEEHVEFCECTCANGHSFLTELLPFMTRTLFNCFGSNVAKEVMSDIHKRKTTKKNEHGPVKRHSDRRKIQKLQSGRE